MKNIFQSKCLLGLAVGDALGEPVEGFNSWDYEEYGKITDFVKEPKITDDTIFTILVAESIIENQKVVGEQIARKFIQSRHKFYRLGPTTSKALDRLEKNPKSKATSGITNGAAMRIAPVGLINDDFSKIIRDTVEASIITHGTDVAISAACAIACAVSAAVEGRNKSDITTQAMRGARRGLRYGSETFEPPIYERILKALNTPINLLPKEIGVWIEAYESVPTAIAVFYRTRSFEEAVITAVNLGGDTDTIGAMVGAISGAYYKEIPEKWIKKIPEKEKLQQLEEKLLRLRKHQF